MPEEHRLLDRLRRHTNVTVTALVAVLCIIVGFATGFWLLFRLSYVILIAIPLAWFWTREMAKGLEVEVQRTDQRVTQGHPIEGRVWIRSRSLLPKVWLEIEDPSTLPGHAARRVLTLPVRGSASWSYRTRTRLRGVYQVGPVTVTARDPFGFFRVTRTFGDSASILVYPSAPELPNFYVPPANLPGEGRIRRRTHNVTPNVSGLRQYAPGDSYNRIHWPSTARMGQPIVKQFELDPASDIWLVLDLERTAHVGEGEESTEEMAVSVAASVARYFIQQNRSVGMITFGDRLRVDEPDRGQNHYTRMLESLALARAVGDAPLSNLLLEESRRFGRHTTVLVITPSTSEEWPLTLISLAGRGVKVAAILIEANTFGDAPSPLDVYGTLASGGVHTLTVKRRDDLGRVLSAGADTDLAPARTGGGA
ncbi:MAG: DUF58 domain-containing protein [Dehalococcoidia bacterium]|nr:DUF58 domain-containing protein [Dehalococcoidia bacterium]MCA9849180.1 DUF58 domain-containing protein [Dehalococcoidia bacterium]MCB9484222.1 DUF58 domain-containing protein [Dehalococcoidia bacterium]MCB9491391.1 DUF58 domain-containing protein [Dehalococcoidia bacterium]